MALSASDSMGSLRSPLARALTAKISEDQLDEQRDHSHWYAVDKSRLDPEISAAFVQSHKDEETVEFLQRSREKSDWLFTELFHSFVTSILSWFLHQTSINGLLRRGSMFVFSQNQIESILNMRQGANGMGPAKFGHTMIDLGAGDGEITKKLAPYFDKVYATETSNTMQWRLRENGCEILPVETWHCIVMSETEKLNDDCGKFIPAEKDQCNEESSVNDNKLESIDTSVLVDNDQEFKEGAGHPGSKIKKPCTEQQGVVGSQLAGKYHQLDNLGKMSDEAFSTELHENSPNRDKIIHSDSTIVDLNEDSIELDCNIPVNSTRLKYDLISCLNLLDRCSRPLDLLRSIRSALVPGTGRLLIAVVLPFSPYVEDEGRGLGHQPHQRLVVQGSTFEEQVSSLVRDTFIPLGFSLERFTRVPYLCEGDLYKSYYVLHDALFLLKPV